MLGAALVASLLVIGAFLIPEGEVVKLQTIDAEGGVHVTDLWIAGLEGRPHLRAGSASAGWLARLRLRPDVELTRMHSAPASPELFRAVVLDDVAVQRALNAAMAAKYGLANSLFGLFLEPDETVAIRLDPRGDGDPSDLPSASTSGAQRASPPSQSSHN